MAPRTLKHIHLASRDDVEGLVSWVVPTPPTLGDTGDDTDGDTDGEGGSAAIGLERLDPFLLVNHHGPQRYAAGSKGLPFVAHPHRGFETVTFVVAGSVAHKEGGNAESVVDAGGVQWLTAGRGLVHSELSPRKFTERGGEVELVQLWLNLPSRWKLTQPKYQALQRKDLPSFRAGGENVAVDHTPISGEWWNEFGPAEPITDVALALMVVGPGGQLRCAVASGKTAFVYVVRGAVTVGSAVATEHSVVEFNDDGDGIALDSDGATVIVGHGTPFGEPVVSYGPFVMNTDEEVRQAIFDARMGRMGRP